MQQQAFLNQPCGLLWICATCGYIFLPKLLEGSVTHFGFYWSMPRCLILQGLHVRTGSSRIQGNQRENVLGQKIASFQCLPTNVVRLVTEE